MSITEKDLPKRKKYFSKFKNTKVKSEIVKDTEWKNFETNLQIAKFRKMQIKMFLGVI